jgi:hypothetical protein
MKMDLARRRKIQFKLNIKTYLAELKESPGVEISPLSLSCLEEIEEIRRKSLHLKDIDKIKYTANFNMKNSDRFRKFIANYRSNRQRLVFGFILNNIDTG